MDRLKYPILYYETQAEQVIGLLVSDEPQQCMSTDLDSLKVKLLHQLQREYRKNGTWPTLAIEDPQYKNLKIKFKPSVITGNSIHPLTQDVEISLPVVYGNSGYGFFNCYLPLLNKQFSYYEEAQLDPLVQYVALSYLNIQDPALVYRMLRMGKPKISTIELRVKNKDDYKWDNIWAKRRKKGSLSKIGEQYPPTKAVRRLNRLAPETAWEVDKYIDQVVEKVLGSRVNVLIVGAPGAGKSAILQQAVKKITNRARSNKLNLQVWRILPQRITGSAKYLGEWQENCEEIIDDAVANNGILWIVSIIRLLMTGGSGPEDSVAAFFSPSLQQGKIQMIGEASPQELESMRRLLPGFVQNFHVINLEELAEWQIRKIMAQYQLFAQNIHKISISNSGMDLAYRLLARFFPYESFPGKIIKFMGKCLNDAKLDLRSSIGDSHVYQQFLQQTGLPNQLIDDELELQETELRQFFEKRIIGQDQAIDQLCSLVKIFKAGLNNPQRPINTMIFAGPTGVGKTASAKALADYFFGAGKQKSPLVRIDMSEYQHPYQLDRLIGSGSEAGSLIREIRQKPFAVLLLDEVEKAHPAIFDALLGMLDEGVLVDGFGRLTFFKNTIIIMTTNLGASNRGPVTFKDTTSNENHYQSAIAKHFRPEFANRIDSIVVFNPLDREGIRKLAIRELNELNNREGFVYKNIRLEFSDQIIDMLMETGFDEKLGARPMQRAIEQLITTPLAAWILANPNARSMTLELDYQLGLHIKTQAL
jgi:ATP-dependent Clp protease ATP-binding subunit ClpC